MLPGVMYFPSQIQQDGSPTKEVYHSDCASECPNICSKNWKEFGESTDDKADSRFSFTCNMFKAAGM